MDFFIIQSAEVEGRLIELVGNNHCEHYELCIDGIPVFNTKELAAAQHEYNMELV
jgi:hypothetical protein